MSPALAGGFFSTEPQGSPQAVLSTLTFAAVGHSCKKRRLARHRPRPAGLLSHLEVGAPPCPYLRGKEG